LLKYCFNSHASIDGKMTALNSVQLSKRLYNDYSEWRDELEAART
jgi:hypothetical protein